MKEFRLDVKKRLEKPFKVSFLFRLKLTYVTVDIYLLFSTTSK